MRNFLSQPHGERLGDLLTARLREPSWTHFRAAVAFAKRSGVKHLIADLRSFAASAQVKMAVGVDLGGTSAEGLTALLDALEGRGSIWVVHNENGSTFHPKVYLFKSDTRAHLIVGSGNLTEGGLFDNYEASLGLELDLTLDDDRVFLEQIEGVLDGYEDVTSGTSIELTRETLARLIAEGYLPAEAYSRRAEEGAPELGPDEDEVNAASDLFERVSVPPPPRIAGRSDATPRTGGRSVSATPGTAAGQALVFYMTLMRTDAGTGQTTAGTQRRSPEIFIPLAARNFAPEFWEWPTGFTADANEDGKLDRAGVRMLIGTRTEVVTMTYFPHRHEFRLRSEPLRSAGEIGDILRIEKTNAGRGYDYIVTVIPQGTAQYAAALAKCVNTVSASRKVWGYE